MKKLLTLLAVGLLAVTGYAQTTNPPPAPTIIGGLEQIGAALGTTVPTNLVIGPYGSAAIDNNKLANWSVGLAAAWNFTENIGVGMAVDYAPDSQDFTLFTGQVTIRTAIRPLTFAGWTNFVVVPYGFAGLGTPLAGAGEANGGVATVAGAGAAIPIISFKGWHFGASGAYANWSGAGDASGNRIYFGLGVNKSF